MTKATYTTEKVHIVVLNDAYFRRFEIQRLNRMMERLK